MVGTFCYAGQCRSVLAQVGDHMESASRAENSRVFAEKFEHLDEGEVWGVPCGRAEETELTTENGFRI